jgi:hypothetical protein
MMKSWMINHLNVVEMFDQGIVLKSVFKHSTLISFHFHFYSWAMYIQSSTEEWRHNIYRKSPPVISRGMEAQYI